MAIVTLIEHIKNNNLTVNILVSDILLNEVKIDYYEINNEHLWLITPESHEVKIPIHDFKEVTFDACALSATNSIEMVERLRYLEDHRPHNAIIMNSKDQFIVGFYKIKNHSHR